MAKGIVLKNKFLRKKGLFSKLYFTIAITTIFLIWLVTLVSDYTESKQSMIAQQHKDTLLSYAAQTGVHIKNNDLDSLNLWVDQVRNKEKTMVAVLKSTPHWLTAGPEKEQFGSINDLMIGRDINLPIHLYFNFNPIMKVPIPDSDYNFMIQLPQQMRPGTYWQLLNTSIRLGFPILLVALICIAIFRHIIAPLRILQKATRKISKGDFNVKLESDLGKRRDEFSDLAQSFDKMAERISVLLNRQQQLIQDISHELRTPITRIKLVLNDSGQDPALKRVEQEVNGMQSLLEETLTLSWLNNQDSDNYEKLKIEDVDLTALIEAIADDASFEFPKHNLILLIPYNFIVHNSNHRAIGQAIENIIRNAMKYSEENSQIEVKLSKANKHDKPWVKITICDQGRGVATEYLEEIFEPFFRIDSARVKKEVQDNQKSSGYGLGLALTKRQIEAIGGHVRAEHNQPCGLRFIIELPLN